MKQYEELEVSETDSDVVKIWISNKSKFPKLFLCAQEILGVPCSSATSERAFSVSGQIFSKARSNLSAKKIEDLSIIRLNKLTIEKYKENHKFEPKEADTETIQELLIERFEDLDVESDEDEEEEQVQDSDFELDDDLDD